MRNLLKIVVSLTILWVLWLAHRDTTKDAATPTPTQHSAPAQQSAPAQAHYLAVTVDQMIADYKKDAKTANNTYNNQYFVVAGTLGHVEYDETGNDIILRGAKNSEIRAHMKASTKNDAVALLHWGDTVGILCDGGDLVGDLVFVRGCELRAVAEDQ